MKQALGLRLYAFVNRQEIIDIDENRIVFRMNECRVQSARKRKNMPDFPCKSVGLVEYESFARTIDPASKPAASPAPRTTIPGILLCLGVLDRALKKLWAGGRPILTCTGQFPSGFKKPGSCPHRGTAG